MQGRKDFIPKLMEQVHLDSLVPSDNFYRQLDETLDLKFLSSESVCKNCPFREQCCGKITKFKKIDDSIHKPLYDKMH